MFFSEKEIKFLEAFSMYTCPLVAHICIFTVFKTKTRVTLSNIPSGSPHSSTCPQTDNIYYTSPLLGVTSMFGKALVVTCHCSRPPVLGPWNRLPQNVTLPNHHSLSEKGLHRASGRRLRARAFDASEGLFTYWSSPIWLDWTAREPQHLAF